MTGLRVGAAHSMYRQQGHSRRVGQRDIDELLTVRGDSAVGCSRCIGQRELTALSGGLRASHSASQDGQRSRQLCSRRHRRSMKSGVSSSSSGSWQIIANAKDSVTPSRRGRPSNTARTCGGGRGAGCAGARSGCLSGTRSRRHKVGMRDDGRVSSAGVGTSRQAIDGQVAQRMWGSACV